MTITEFLEARITEDEVTARAATPGPWVDGGNGYIEDVPEFDLHRFDIMPQTIAQVELAYEDATYIARHDPARVLAECAAKRAIIELAQQASEVEKEFDDYEWAGAGPEQVDPWIGDAILFALASVYADHPGYQQEWAK